MQIYAIIINFNFHQDFIFKIQCPAGYIYFMEIKLKECLGLSSPEVGNYSKTWLQRKILPLLLWLLLSSALPALCICFSQCEHHLGFLRFIYLLSVERDLFLPVHGICFSCRLFGINLCDWSFCFCCSCLLQMYLMPLIAADSRILW